MSRLVRRFRNQPYSVTAGEETLSICGCGLSATQPFCDGTHTLSESEQANTLCWYDDAGGRHIVSESYPGMRSDKRSKNSSKPVETTIPGDQP